MSWIGHGPVRRHAAVADVELRAPECDVAREIAQIVLEAVQEDRGDGDLCDPSRGHDRGGARVEPGTDESGPLVAAHALRHA